MKRVTPRQINTYRPFFKKYADRQLTLEEIVAEFKDYKIYSFIDNADVHIVNADNKTILFLESIGYDDDDAVPTIYQASFIYIGQDICDIATVYADFFGRANVRRIN